MTETLEETLENNICSKTGKLITFEGPEGGGKSTIINLIKDYLGLINYPIVCTREPGGTAVADMVRQILLDPHIDDLGDEAELYLMLAARAHKNLNIVKPALEAGEIIITDRDYHSSIVYQGFARGLGMEKVIALNEISLYGITPDLVFILDVPPETGLKRAGGGGLQLDRIEAAGFEFHKKVREGYKALKSLLPHENIVYVDATKKPEEVLRTVWPYIQELLGVKGNPYDLPKSKNS
ncbi:MAG: dTMP kinase [Nanoarchaeota archaeon]|nr:dTMP kinase [Nanoarchaeota archaeon]